MVTLPLVSTENLLTLETVTLKLELISKVPAIVVFPVAPATINLFVFKVKPPRKEALPLVSIFNLVSVKPKVPDVLSKFSLSKSVVNGFASFQA